MREKVEAKLAQVEQERDKLAASILPDNAKRASWDIGMLMNLATAHRCDSLTMDDCETPERMPGYPDWDVDQARLKRQQRLEHAEAELTALKARLTLDAYYTRMWRTIDKRNRETARGTGGDVSILVAIIDWLVERGVGVTDDTVLAQRLTDAPAPKDPTR